MVRKPRNRIPTTKWHHGMLSRMMARNITLGTQSMARLLGDTLNTYGHNNSSNLYTEAMKYLNTLVSVIDLAQRNFGTVRRDLQMHQTILETWEDSDSITNVNARKDLRHATKMVA